MNAKTIAIPFSAEELKELISNFTSNTNIDSDSQPMSAANSGFNTATNPTHLPYEAASNLSTVAWHPPQPFQMLAIPVVFEPNYFPLNKLPRRLRQAVMALHIKVKAPIPICVISILSAASIACSAGHRVTRFNDLQSNIALFLLAIAASGERKTTCDNLATLAITEVEAMLREAFDKDTVTFNTALATWKALRSGVLAALKRAAASGKDTQDLEERLAKITANEPTKPVLSSILLNDATPEAITEHLADNAFSGLFSNDACAIFKAKTLNNLGILNIAWDAGTIRVNRKGLPPLFVDTATLTISLMTQWEVLQSFLKTKGELARANGFLARLLITYPISTQGQRFEGLSDVDCSADLDEFHEWTKNLLLSAIDESGHLEHHKKQLEFTPAAKELCRNYHNFIEQNLQPFGQLADVRDAASKIGDNMARLAAIFHLASDNDGDITVETTDAAIEVSGYFLTEFKRLFVQAPPVPAWQTDAMNLWDSIRRIVGRINQHQIPKTYVRQRAPGNLRNKTLFDSALKTLENWGWAQVYEYDKTMYVNVIRQA